MNIKCSKCGNTIILLTEEYWKNFNKELECPYCHSTKLKVKGKYDDMRKIMSEGRIYVRSKGAIKEIKQIKTIGKN